jgi:DNA (cytosine-5)-methyltransferase 1
VRQLILPIAAKMFVDLFAGGGGASTGIEQAIGRHVDVAINHDRHAVALHRANHPQTKHYTTNVWDVDPRKVCDRPVGGLWASPDCRHFSPAKGAAPVSDRVRSLAWVVVKWATHVRPDIIFLENIPEFKNWGPVIAGRPCSERKGKTFKRWKQQLVKLGYSVEFKELRACDYDTPTIRKRLFMVARCDGLPIVWPEPTNGPGLKPYRTAAECIDFTIPCPSIFERKKSLATATERRIAHGLFRYVIDSPTPFIVGAGGPAYAAKPRSVDEPMGVITTENHRAITTPYIARIGQTGGGGKYSNSVQEPLTTATTKAEHLLIAPTLIDAAHGDVSPTGVKRWGQGHRSIESQVPTITANGGNAALVTAFLAKHYGGHDGPGIPADGPLSTVTTQDHHHLVAAHITKFRTGSAGTPATDPVPTVTSNSFVKRPGGAPPLGLVTSHLAKLRGTSNSAATDEPLATVSAGGWHHAEVRAFLVKYYGTQQDPDLGEPMHTVPTKDRFGLVMVSGEAYEIADIGMRMLQPRELFRAQGFADSYIIEEGIDEFGKPLKMTKTVQVRLCGNSVCPPVARVIVAANFSDIDQRLAA